MASDLTAPWLRPTHVYAFDGHLPPDGRSWRFSQERMAALSAENSLRRIAGRRPALKRYLADVVDLAPEPPAVPLAAIVRQFSRDLALTLARHPGALSNVEWRDLERVLAEVCGGLGFAVTLTRPAKDGGFDLSVLVEGTRYLVEVKHWSAPNRVGTGVVSQFAEIVVSERAVRGLLLSSSGFRPAVLAERLEMTRDRVALGDGRKITGLCQRYARRDAGMWCPTTDLAEVLFEDTV